MKIKVAVILLICLAGAYLFFYNSFYSKVGQDIDTQALFTRWDKGEVEDSEKPAIIEALMADVSENPQASKSDIQALSPNITVFEADNYSLIQYIENPEFYGSSGRESYQVVVYNGQPFLVSSRGSMRVDEILKRDDDLFVVLATDYRMSNITGVQILTLEIDNQTVKVNHLINKEDLSEEFTYDATNHILYYDSGHIYFKEIQDNGNEIVVTAGDRDYIVRWAEDEYYHLLPIN